MESVYLNGGIIGPKLNFITNEKYITGETLAVGTPVYIGGMSVNLVGRTTSTSIDFALTGGIGGDLQYGDLIVIVFATGSTVNRTSSIFPPRRPSGGAYTEIFRLYANDLYDTNMFVGYTYMASIPDTGFVLPSGTGSSLDGGGVTLQVWRNVAPFPSQFSATSQSVVSANTVIPTPPSITPVGDRSVIIACAAGAHGLGARTYSSPSLDNFRTAYGSDTNDVVVGMGSHNWNYGDGTYTPSQWTYSGTSATTNSNIAVTIALAPGSVPVYEYGNYKNSGIWSLDAVLRSKTYSYNGFSYSSADVSTSTPAPLTGIQAGDYIFAYGSTASGGANPFILPAGYTQIAYDDVTQSNMLFYKIADGSETSISLADTQNTLSLSVLVVRGISGFTAGSAISAQASSLELSVVENATGKSLFAFAAARDRSSPYDMVWDESVLGMSVLSSTPASNGTANFMSSIIWSEITPNGNTFRTINAPINAIGLDSCSAVLLYVF